jgi:sugar lactone lactonase YvrE
MAQLAKPAHSFTSKEIAMQHILSSRYRRRLGLAAALMLSGSALLAGSVWARGADRALRLEAASDTMIWNAVAVAGKAIYVSGPRWAGGSGPQLARLIGKRLDPYPDPAWNSWKSGEDASAKFVNINALHADGKGGLWAVDSGSPQFGGDPLPGGAKLVRIDLASGKVTRVIPFGPKVAKPGSYVDDVRFRGAHGYLTDAGNPGIIVLDLVTGASRRVLDGDRSTLAPKDRPIQVDGTVLNGPDGTPLRVHSDPMELSPDGEWLLYGPLHGPWSRVPTGVLNDATLAPAQVAAAVEPFAELPPMGGSAIDAAGNLYFSDLAADAIRRRAPDGTITTIAQDPRLHWVDAMTITPDGRLWMPAAQLDRVALFHGGTARVRRPVQLFSLALNARPEIAR